MSIKGHKGVVEYEFKFMVYFNPGMNSCFMV